MIYGRERERAQLRELLDDAVAGHGVLVLISGEAGIGKTTLVDDLIHEAGQRGCLVLTGGCYDLTTTPPYGPWIDLFDALSTESDQQRAVPAPLQSNGRDRAIQSQAALFAAVRELLSATANERPLVIVIEDLHWSDQASLDLLRFLARHVETLGALMIATYRDDELTRSHPLFQFLPLIVQESGAVRLELQPLSSVAIRQLVARRGLSQADSERLAAYLEKRAAGNPLFTAELLRSLEQEGVIRVDGSRATLGDLSESFLPSFLLQVIERRLTRLDPEGRQALEIAAVIGSEVPFEIWESVSGLEPALLDSIVERAIETHTLEVGSDHHTLRFTHALVREVLYEGMIPTRRRTAHRQAGSALARAPNPDPDAVAYHFQHAGDERAAKWLARAGMRAECRYALVMAARSYDAAQALLEGDQDLLAERGWLLFRIGRLLTYAVTSAQTLPYLQEARRIAAVIDDPVLAAYALESHGHIRCLSGDMRRGIAELEAAVTAIDDLPEADRARTASPLVQWIGASINGIWLAGEVVMPGVMEGINPCQHTLIHWYALSGRLHESVAMGEDIIARATAVLRDGFPLQDVCYQGYLGLARAYMLLGQPDRARKWFALAHAALDALGHHALLLFSYLEELRLVLIFHGDRPHERRRLALDVFRTAQRAGQAHNANSRTFDNVYALVVDVLEGRSTLARKQGRPQLAWSWVRTMLPDGLDYEFGDCLFRCSSEMQRLAASLSLDAGDLDTARSWIEAHDRWLKWAKSIVGQAEGALLWARYYQQSGDLAQARRYADRALVVASEPPQQLMLTAAYRFLGQLAIQEGNLADAETHLSRSLTLTRACQIPYEEALTLLITAELRIATGNSTEALALLERVRQICEPMGAKLALDAATALEARLEIPIRSPADLTPREVEVLSLIVAGRSNREIGDALFLSPRTVERHIANIYLKLNVHSRAEAIEFARRHHFA